MGGLGVERRIYGVVGGGGGRYITSSKFMGSYKWGLVG